MQSDDSSNSNNNNNQDDIDDNNIDEKPVATKILHTVLIKMRMYLLRIILPNANAKYST